MKVSLFAVCLMWATSLKVAFFISSIFVSVPDVKHVVRSAQNSLDIIQAEKRSFDMCVNAQLNRCADGLSVSKRAELIRINATSDWNANIIDTAAQIQTGCFMLYSSLYRSIEKYVAAGGGLTYLTETCNSTDRDSLSVMVGDLSGVRSQAFEISSSYSEESMHTVTRLAQYAEERAIYDSLYIDNHTLYMQNAMESHLSGIDIPTLDLTSSFEEISLNAKNLVSCVSLRNDDEGECGFSNPARRSMEIITGTYSQNIDSLLQQWDLFDENAKKYKDNAVDAYESALEFYHGTSILLSDVFVSFCLDNNSFRYLIGANDFVNRMKSVVVFFDNSWLGDWYKIPPSSFYAVEVPFPKTRPNFISLPSLDEVWNDVSFNVDIFDSNMSIISELVSKNIEAFRQDMRHVLVDPPSLIPQDYNPPDFVGRNGSIITVDSESDVYRCETEVSLKTLIVFCLFSDTYHAFLKEISRTISLRIRFVF